MKRQATKEQIALCLEDDARVAKYASKHLTKMGKWEKDARFALTLIAAHKTAMKKSQQTFKTSSAILKKLEPKLDAAEKALKEAEDGGDAKAIKAAEKEFKRLDGLAMKAVLDSAGAQGGYWGAVLGCGHDTEALKLTLDSPY